jgi:ParB family chromosome partitioning protein
LARKAESGSRGLGRGLSALLDDVDRRDPDWPGAEAAEQARAQAEADAARSPTDVPIELLRRNPEQPRRHFAESDLEELADSIREKGVLQPILVRPAPGAPGEWQIVAGERRWRAAQRAELKTVPVLVRDLDDLEVLEVAIIENVQRADLNAVEEALGYKALLDRFGRTQDAVAKVVGKSRAHVANTLRLLQLPEEVQQHLSAGRLSAGHARAIAATPDPAGLARRILDEGLNVRQAEELAKAREPEAKTPRSGGRSRRNADIQSLEQDLEDVLGVSVEVRDRDGRGELRLKYSSLEQLDDLCRRLTG